MERSLFAAPAERRAEEHGRIYHEILKRDEPEIKPEVKMEKIEKVEKSDFIQTNSNKGIPMREEPIVTATPQKRESTIPAPEDEEAWGAIPAFLRRHKK